MPILVIEKSVSEMVEQPIEIEPLAVPSRINKLWIWILCKYLAATIRMGTPLLIVAIGELVCEKSGVLNLGQKAC